MYATPKFVHCISLQKGLLPVPGEARHDWQIISDFAQKLGYQKDFHYQNAAEIFREHAALSGFENHGDRCFDISGLQDISDEDYLSLEPCYWPLSSHTDEPGPETKNTKNTKDTKDTKGTRRLFEDGHFFTKSGRASLIPITAQFPRKTPRNGQLIMNTGRIRDQWHTMTRTGSSAKLMGHLDEPYVDIHPQDALSRHIHAGDLVKLQNRNSVFLGRARVTNDVRKGDIFVPMHWNDRYASHSRTDALVNAITDPLCGQPEYKHSPVEVTAYQPAWQGFLLTTDRIQPECEYWSQILLAQGYKYRLADQMPVNNWSEWLKTQFPAITQWSEIQDSDNHFFRAAGFLNNQLQVYVSIDRQPILALENTWLESRLGKSANDTERFSILAGSLSDRSSDEGKIICSCYQVGEKTIENAIAAGNVTTESLGEKLKCGTNCGSCLPELNALIQENTALNKSVS